MNKLGLINSLGSVIPPSTFKPFAVFMLVQQMRAIPEDYLGAARIDGAGISQVFGKIALPTLQGAYNPQYNVRMTGSLVSMVPITSCTSWPSGTSKMA